MRFAALFLAFFVSGLTGLVYEVAWFHRLELVFGASTHALGTILAVFMAGLGLGAWVLGRWADRPGSTARRYAILELGIGGWAVLSPLALGAVESIYSSWHGAGGVATKVLLAAVALFPATFLMGGTLPVAVRGLASVQSRRSWSVGWLYGLNTLGAVTGTLLAGLWWVPRFGIVSTVQTTAALNFALAALAYLAGSRFLPEAAVESEASSSAPEPDADRRVRVGLALAVLTGFVGLSLEVAWTRALGTALGSTAHVFTIVLAATLTGIGLGSLLAVGVRRHGWAVTPWIVGSMVWIALACAGFLLVYESFVGALFILTQSRALTYDQLLLGYFVLSMGLILPATAAMGLSFPLLTQLAARSVGDAGRSVGRLLLGNTGGSIAGSVLAAFVLIPTLGTAGILKLSMVLIAAAVLILAWRTPSLRASRWPTVAGGLVAILALLVPAWSLQIMDLNPTRLRARGLPDAPGEYDQLFRSGGFAQPFAKEGVNTLVTIRTSGVSTQLRIGGKTDASSVADMPTQVMAGVVPFLARPQASRVMVIGVGSGVSLRVAADFPSVERIDCVEIESAVVEAARLHFADVNHGVLDRDEVNLVLDDARTILHRGEMDYDVIISEPPNPSLAGVANLFTADHYENVKDSLAPGGVLLQWVQLYENDIHMLRRMLGTFTQSFRYADLWWVYPADLLILGSHERLQYDRAAIRQAVAGNRGLRADLWPILHSRDADELFARYLVPLSDLAPLLTGVIPYRDDRPELAHQAARNRYEGASPFSFIDTLWRVRLQKDDWWPDTVVDPPDSDHSLRLASARYLESLSSRDAVACLTSVFDPEAAALVVRNTPDLFLRQRRLNGALQTWPNHPELMIEVARLHWSGGDREAALATLAGLGAVAGSLEYYWLKAQALDPVDELSAEELVRACEAGLEEFLSREDHLAKRRQLLARLVDASGAAPRATDVLESMAREALYDYDVQEALAAAYLRGNQPRKTVDVLDRLEETNFTQSTSRARLLRVFALAQMGDPQLASELQRLLRDFPDQAQNQDLFPLLRR